MQGIMNVVSPSLSKHAIGIIVIGMSTRAPHTLKKCGMRGGMIRKIKENYKVMYYKIKHWDFSRFVFETCCVQYNRQ